MRMCILVGLLSATVTVAILDAWVNVEDSLSPFHEAAAAGRWDVAADSLEGVEKREARTLSQAAIAMEMAGRTEEADYLYAEAVQAAGEQYGHSHPITESYRRRYLSFYYKSQGRTISGTPTIQIAPLQKTATVSTLH